MDNIEILLVEDNSGDIRLIQESFKDCRIRNKLNVVTDGESAIRYLKCEEPYTTAKMPDLVLLDLNLPGIKGTEVLEFIKSDPKLMHIPVVILTASQAERDIMKTYALHANCYISKPIDFDEFSAVVHSVTDFWFNIVKLPPNGGV